MNDLLRNLSTFMSQRKSPTENTTGTGVSSFKQNWNDDAIPTGSNMFCEAGRFLLRNKSYKHPGGDICI